MDIRKVVERKFSELEMKIDRIKEENKELARLANLLDKFDHIECMKSLESAKHVRCANKTIFEET